jgi:Uncharacterized phage-associated protein
MLSPLVYANSIIKMALERQVSISPMKLQKLLYLLYARHLAKYEQPIFADNFEKWQYGPVVSEVYYAFKGFGASPITKFHRDSDGDVYVVGNEAERVMGCLDEVWKRYSGWSGMELSTLTHRPGSAWSKALEMGVFLKLEEIKNDGNEFFS